MQKLNSRLESWKKELVHLKTDQKNCLSNQCRNQKQIHKENVN